MSKNIEQAANAVREKIAEVEPQFIGRPWLEVAEAVSPMIETILERYKGVTYDFIMGEGKIFQVILFEERNKQNALIV